MSSWPHVLTTPAMQLSLLPLLGMALLQCLVAIWAATSRGHWFIRAVGVWMAIALLVPIGVWEAAWLFAISSPLVVLLLNVIRWLRRQPALEIASSAMAGTGKPLHFGTRDLFLLLLIVGMWLPVLVEIAGNYRPSKVGALFVSAVSLALIAVFCQLIVSGPRRVWTAVIFLCLWPSAAYGTWASGDWMHIWELAGVHPRSVVDGVVGLAIVGLELALFLTAILALGSMWHAQRQSTGRHFVLTILLGLILLVPAIPTATMYWALAKRVPRAPKYVTPTVNRYPRIVAIAAELQRLNPKELSLADLKAAAPSSTAPQQVAALYAELLPLLEAPNAAGYDPDRDTTAGYSPPIQLLRSLARAMEAEGKSTRSAGQADRAADFAEANIRLGTMLRRGGTMFEGIVGIALEGVGQNQLARLRKNLSPERSSAAIALLRRSLAEHEPFASIYARELDYIHRALGWQGRLEDANARLLGDGKHWSIYFQEACAGVDATNLLLQADLAIRLFKHEHDRFPNDLGELVPAFLPEVPLDTHSQQPVKYRVENGEFVLYSVGFDGRDDGGKFGSATAYNNARRRNEPGLDFDLDTLARR